MIQPLNTLATWVLSVACIMNVLHVVGYNVQPLLAAGGVSGIALGFGAQKITQNLLAGITLVRWLSVSVPRFYLGKRRSLYFGPSLPIKRGVHAYKWRACRNERNRWYLHAPHD